MMTVKAVKSAGQAKNYFGREAKLEKEIGGYYSHDTAFGGGRWMGRGAEELGLKGRSVSINLRRPWKVTCRAGSLLPQGRTARTDREMTAHSRPRKAFQSWRWPRATRA